MTDILQLLLKKHFMHIPEKMSKYLPTFSEHLRRLQQ